MDRWDARHTIVKEEVDLSKWDLSKGDDEKTTASKMRRERQLAILTALHKGRGKMNADMEDMGEGPEGSGTDAEDVAEGEEPGNGKKKKPFGGKKAPPFQKQ
jgi:hypothetical protein